MPLGKGGYLNMNRYAGQILVVFFTLAVVSVAFFESEAFARAGGGRSMGSRGTRSYSQPVSPSPYRQATPAPSRPSPFQQPAPAGGLFRNMAGGMLGGIAGGMLGGMLFRSMGFGGGMGGGYGGPGLFDILLLVGIGYLIYRFIKKRREQSAYEGHASAYGQSEYQQPQQAYSYGSDAPAIEHQAGDIAGGIANIRQMDYGFDENRFKDTVMDLFFKVQGAWMNRDLSPVSGILTDEMRGILQEDVQRLLREKRINRLENIAVRSVDITEAWQESGQDFITAQVYANLLDYTTDEAGTVVEGSKTDPVKFEEYWTFSRPVGNNPWRLSAIQQA